MFQNESGALRISQRSIAIAKFLISILNLLPVVLNPNFIGFFIDQYQHGENQSHVEHDFYFVFIKLHQVTYNEVLFL
jgi:hypothetical protein